MGTYAEALCAGILEVAERALPILAQEAQRDPEVRQLHDIVQAALAVARRVKANV